MNERRERNPREKYYLVKLENVRLHGLSISRGLGEGVVIENFGRIFLRGFDKWSAVLGIQENFGDEVELHKLDNAAAYGVKGTEYELGVTMNTLEHRRNLVLNFPRDMAIHRDIPPFVTR